MGKENEKFSVSYTLDGSQDQSNKIKDKIEKLREIDQAQTAKTFAEYGTEEDFERWKKQEKLEQQANINHQGMLQGWDASMSSPREYLHNFLLQAKHAGCNVDNYIEVEIKKMINELER